MSAHTPGICDACGELALSRHTCYSTAIAIDGGDYENVLADPQGAA